MTTPVFPHTAFVILRDGTYVGVGTTLAEAAKEAKDHLKASPMVYRVDAEELPRTEMLEFRLGEFALKAGFKGRVRKWGPWSKAMAEDAPTLTMPQRTALRYLLHQGRAVYVGYTVKRSTAMALRQMGLVVTFPGSNNGLMVEPSADGRAYPF
jgi:hypothetical protein